MEIFLDCWVWLTSYYKLRYIHTYIDGPGTQYYMLCSLLFSCKININFVKKNKMLKIKVKCYISKERQAQVESRVDEIKLD